MILTLLQKSCSVIFSRRCETQTFSCTSQLMHPSIGRSQRFNDFNGTRTLSDKPAIIKSSANSDTLVETKSVETNSPVSPIVVEDGIKAWKLKVEERKLKKGQIIVHRKHLHAVQEGQETYYCEIKGANVFTILCHLRRGKCCGSGCRHCPYEHVNAPIEKKQGLRYNSAFYSPIEIV